MQADILFRMPQINGAAAAAATNRFANPTVKRLLRVRIEPSELQALPFKIIKSNGQLKADGRITTGLRIR